MNIKKLLAFILCFAFVFIASCAESEESSGTQNEPENNTSKIEQAILNG